jgi:hypothetical protein
MNGPLDCPFCGVRPTHWYVEEGVPYVVCDGHAEPIKMRLREWNVRNLSTPTRTERFNNYRIRRIEAYRGFELLEKVVDNLGVEDGSQAPLPDMPLPVTPSEAHKNELKNAATTLLRTILIWNDGNVSQSGLQRW